MIATFQNPLGRRSFLANGAAALGAGVFAHESPLAAFQARAAEAAPPMKVTSVGTTHWKSRNDAPFEPQWMWVRIETDTGLVGIGETFPRSEVEAAMVHNTAAGALLGRDPRDIERIWADLYRIFDHQVGGGTEMRAHSAIDLALWDLYGKALRVPVYRLIGGKSNPRVRLYNTCYSSKYDFLKEPEKLVDDLMSRCGIRAFKIWPFDAARRRNKSQYVTGADIEEGLGPVRKLREKFGMDIEILMEFHGLWDLTSAVRIAKALEPYKPMWLEDMILPGNYEQYRRLADQTSLPLTISERTGNHLQYLRLLESRAASYVMFDLCWCGGLTSARRIATLADAYLLPVTPHTAGGPLLFYASTHFSTAATNVAIQESVERYWAGVFPKVLANPIQPKDGAVEAPELPGFGMEVKPEIWKHPAAITQTSKL